jgi:hypothetical protein
MIAARVLAWYAIILGVFVVSKLLLASLTAFPVEKSAESETEQH